MFPRRYSHLGLLFTVVALAGCGGQKRVPEGPSVHRPPVTHDFVENLDKVYAGKYVTQCELDRKERIYAVARRIDEFLSSEGSTVDANTNENYRTVDYRGFKIRENLRPAGKDEWITEEGSWDDIIQSLESLGANPPASKLASLRRYFGAVLSDDIDRTKWGYLFGLRHKNLDFVRGISAKAAECRRKSECRSSPFTPDEFRWLEVQPHFKELREEYAAIAFHTYLDQLVEEIDGSIQPAFVKNSAVTLDEKGVLNLPLVAGEFSELTEVLSRYIEPMWKDVATALHIEWRPSQNVNGDLYTLIMKQGGLGRSSMSHYYREVYLYSEVRSHSLAHEIGHVLGFPDRYYTYWDAEKCAYFEDFNRADLMSASDTGVVLAPDIGTLRSVYRK